MSTVRNDDDTRKRNLGTGPNHDNDKHSASYDRLIPSSRKLVPPQQHEGGRDKSSSREDVETVNDDCVDFTLERFKRNLAASDEEYRRDPPTPKAPTEAYFTAPKAYSIDVDRGILNTRAWVLQERLLAPRTIHFTRDHIYCEDQDDLCGEDWVRQYFTWLSCVNKTSKQRRAGLFPEAKFANMERAIKGKGKDVTDHDIWFQRSMYSKPESQRIAHPWLRICEKFSKCLLTYQTDRLAALSGLVERVGMLRFNEPEIKRNFLGLWEDDLHQQLAWISPRGTKMRLLHDLQLPSWTWLSYDGAITFRDQTPHFSTNSRNSKLPRYPPYTELELQKADVPDMMAQLPLKRPASLMLKCRLRNVHAVSSKLVETDKMRRRTRDQLSSLLPFHLDPRTETMPALLLQSTDCHEISDQAKNLIGFISFDEDVQVAGQILCLHISTLCDVAHSHAMQESKKPGMESVNFNDYSSPILAYALAVVKVRTCPEGTSEYRRIGLAEVNHRWIAEGHEDIVRLI